MNVSKRNIFYLREYYTIKLLFNGIKCGCILYYLLNVSGALQQTRSAREFAFKSVKDIFKFI